VVRRITLKANGRNHPDSSPSHGTGGGDREVNLPAINGEMPGEPVQVPEASGESCTPAVKVRTEAQQARIRKYFEKLKEKIKAREQSVRV